MGIPSLPIPGYIRSIGKDHVVAVVYVRYILGIQANRFYIVGGLHFNIDLPCTVFPDLSFLTACRLVHLDYFLLLCNGLIIIFKYGLEYVDPTGPAGCLSLPVIP